MNRVFLAFLLALAGCGKADPAKPEAGKPDGKGQPTPGGPTASPGSGDKGGPSPVAPTTPGPELLSPSDPVQQLAERFITDLRAASEKPEPLSTEMLGRVSPAFLKVIGKPLRSDEDKKRGYSANEASTWLKNIGVKLVGIGLPTGYGSPAAAVLTGSFGNGSGRYLVRMTFQDGWKLDWLSLGIIAVPPMKPATTDGSYQDFAVLAFLDALTGNVTSKDDRVRQLGGISSTKLKAAWAEPFEQDKSSGLDYNATKLGLKLDELGGGVTGFSRTAADVDTFRIETAKGNAKTTYTLKLTKGAAPGEWLVDEFMKQ